MTEIHWHSTGNFDEDLKAYFGHLHDNNSWYKHKVQKYLGKKAMDLFSSFKKHRGFENLFLCKMYNEAAVV